MPLHITFLVVQRASSYLKQTHAHSGSYFGKLYGLIAGLDEDVVSDFDGVLNVLKTALKSI